MEATSPKAIRWRANLPVVSSPEKPLWIYLPKAPGDQPAVRITLSSLSVMQRHAARVDTKPPLSREWRACNSITLVRDQTVGRRAAYLYTLYTRRPVERRRSCRVVSRREEPKARSLSSLPYSIRPRRQLHLPCAATRWPHSPLGI